VGERSARVFLLPCKSEQEAKVAFEAYRDMLGKTGVPVELTWIEEGPENRVSVKVDLLDTFEAGFRIGEFVAGITEAEDQEVAEDGLGLLFGLLR
jgi:hypothetical protein